MGTVWDVEGKNLVTGKPENELFENLKKISPK